MNHTHRSLLTCGFTIKPLQYREVTGWYAPITVADMVFAGMGTVFRLLTHSFTIKLLQYREVMGWYSPITVAGMVFVGTGTVFRLLTRGIPVRKPNNHQMG